MKKKIYNTPVADIVEMQFPSIMEGFSGEFEDGQGGGQGGDSGNQGTNEYVGGSWENIWGNM
ncbi:MAG: hypothetical protein IJZ22_08995 [Bacteroidaceae bacterium]|nr:hypothetical protein [Bacteroidaceae bacterium]